MLRTDSLSSKPTGHTHKPVVFDVTLANTLFGRNCVHGRIEKTVEYANNFTLHQRLLAHMSALSAVILVQFFFCLSFAGLFYFAYENANELARIQKLQQDLVAEVISKIATEQTT
jgi:hypothetical protein